MTDYGKRVGHLESDDLYLVQVFLCDGVYTLLTPCCNASGKGSCNSDSGVVCRACYEEVDGIHGAFWTPEQWQKDSSSLGYVAGVES
jgi:hypothetical protein